jgi:hypothetical protein
MDAGLNLYLGPVHIVVQVRLVDLLPTARTKLLRELHRVASTRLNYTRMLCPAQLHWIMVSVLSSPGLNSYSCVQKSPRAWRKTACTSPFPEIVTFQELYSKNRISARLFLYSFFKHYWPGTPVLLLFSPECHGHPSHFLLAPPRTPCFGSVRLREKCV